MDRRDFLKLSIGFVAGGTVALAASAQAAPLPPGQSMPTAEGVHAEPAVISQNDVDHIKPEQVRAHGHGRGHARHHGHRRWHHHRRWWHRRWHHRHHRH